MSNFPIAPRLWYNAKQKASYLTPVEHMIRQNQTWTILTLFTLFFIGTAAHAQEGQRTAAETQANITRLQSEINRLQEELRRAEWDAAREAEPDAYLWITLIDTVNQPIADAQATLTYRIEKEDEPQTLETLSNAQGEVFFPPITVAEANEESMFVLHVEKGSLVPIKLETSLAHFTRQAERRQPLFTTAKMEQAVRIIGRFIQESGEPVSDVFLRAERTGSSSGSFRYYSSPSVQQDSEGRFSIFGSRNEASVLIARHADFVPKRFSVSQTTARRANASEGISPDGIGEIDLGDIVLKSGEFRPTIQVLDKEGKPVSDLWVKLRMIQSQEEADLFARNRLGNRVTNPSLERALFQIDNGESVLTDADGKATFGHAETGRYYIEFTDEQRRMYNILPKTVDFSPDAPMATVRESKNVNVTVHFSDNTTTPERTRRTVIIGNMLTVGNITTFSDIPSAGPRYPGEDQFSFQIPDQLQGAELVLDLPLGAVDSQSRINNELSYRAVIEGEVVEPEPSGLWKWVSFPLERIYDGQKIEIICYQSPKITLNVVDEEGKPVKEFVAAAQYTKRGQVITFTQTTDPRDATPRVTAEGLEHNRNVFWDTVNTGRGPTLGSTAGTFGMDVEFFWRNFGEDTAKVNFGGIFPDEELRLYVIARGYDVVEQTLKLAEGEERELTIYLSEH